jgi:hypothetical protein
LNINACNLGSFWRKTTDEILNFILRVICNLVKF